MIKIIRGLYTAASGMMAEMKRTNIISNNLANTNTTGFKKDFTTFKQLMEKRIQRINDNKQNPQSSYIGNLGTGIELERTYIDFTQGSLKRTNDTFDLALQGNGFFTIETDQGIRYTRCGNFTINQDGYLITKEGNRVLGENGPIRVLSDEVTVTENGEVWDEGYFVDYLRIAGFQDPTRLSKTRDGVYRYEGDAEDEFLPEAKVKQGYLETSNVNSIREMVKMINATRAYEANQKIIKMHDQTLNKSVNDVARI